MALKPLYLLLAIPSLTLAVLGVAIQPSHNRKRDDDLPARVPYVFPAPGTDPVSTESYLTWIFKYVLHDFR